MNKQILPNGFYNIGNIQALIMAKVNKNGQSHFKNLLCILTQSPTQEPEHAQLDLFTTQFDDEDEPDYIEDNRSEALAQYFSLLNDQKKYTQTIEKQKKFSQLYQQPLYKQLIQQNEEHLEDVNKKIDSLLRSYQFTEEELQPKRKEQPEDKTLTMHMVANIMLHHMKSHLNTEYCSALLETYDFDDNMKKEFFDILKEKSKEKKSFNGLEAQFNELKEMILKPKKEQPHYSFSGMKV